MREVVLAHFLHPLRLSPLTARWGRIFRKGVTNPEIGMLPMHLPSYQSQNRITSSPPPLTRMLPGEPSRGLRRQCSELTKARDPKQ